ncbi:hypothetical protein RRF57_005359 [Xylaria bambusicola]|uniref:Uncharacterized protein n=1 Tax=Xylaria bambusicola TaxID=326684 RepID=A0AAN7UXW6_9PEZI
MPEKRYSRNSGRHRRVSSMIARPALLIGERLDNGDKDAKESDSNTSPGADKSHIRFTIERRQDNSDDDNDSGRGRNNGDGQGRDRISDDDTEDERDGCDGCDRNSRGGSRNRSDFREQDDEDGDGGRETGSGDDKGGNDRGGNRGGDNKGGGGDNKGNDDSEDDSDGDDDSDSDDESSTSLPPSPTTSTDFTPEASTTMRTVISTTPTVSITSAQSTPTMSTTLLPTPKPTTSATSQTNTISTLTSLSASGPSSVTTPATAMLITQSTDNAEDSPPASTSGTLADSSASTQYPTNARGRFGDSHGEDGQGRWNGRGDGRGNGRGNEGGLSATSERILIAAGSIGIFIVLCFIFWVVYRTIKKSKQPGRKNRTTTWTSWLFPGRRKPQMKNTQSFNGFNDFNEPLPAYDAGNNNPIGGYGYYDQRKLYPVQSESMAYPLAATLRNSMTLEQTVGDQPLPPTNYMSSYPRPSNQMVDIDDVNSTLRSRMPGPYYNQSEFARQPSDAYDPAQRRVYRASELSSLSSGFGDGDIIIPQPSATLARTPAAARETANTDEDSGNIRPFSWMSRTGTEQQHRDTMYTTASDRRSRFRSVNSWVDQQKRRMKKAAG